MILEEWCRATLCWSFQLRLSSVESFKRSGLHLLGQLAAFGLFQHPLFCCVVGSLPVRSGWVCFCDRSFCVLCLASAFPLFVKAFPTFSNEMVRFSTVSEYYLLLFSILWLVLLGCFCCCCPEVGNFPSVSKLFYSRYRCSTFVSFLPFSSYRWFSQFLDVAVNWGPNEYLRSVVAQVPMTVPRIFWTLQVKLQLILCYHRNWVSALCVLL